MTRECARFGGHVCYMSENHGGPHVCGEPSNQKPCRARWSNDTHKCRNRRCCTTSPYSAGFWFDLPAHDSGEDPARGLGDQWGRGR